MTVVFNWHTGVVWCCLGLCFPISYDLTCMLRLLQALIWVGRWKSPLAASEIPLGIRDCPAPFVRLLDGRYLPRPNSSLVTSNDCLLVILNLLCVMSPQGGIPFWESLRSGRGHSTEQVLITSMSWGILNILWPTWFLFMKYNHEVQSFSKRGML